MNLKEKQHAKFNLNELAKFVQLTAEHEISMRWSIGAMMEKSHLYSSSAIALL